MNQEKIGKFIAKLRKEKKMTQQELAEKLNVTDKAVSKWENGRCLMDMALLKPLSECLGVSVIELINGERITDKDASNKSNEIVCEALNYEKKKAKKNKTKIILGTIFSVVIIFCLVYCSYKGFMLVMYNASITDIDKIKKGLEVENTLTIYKKTIAEDKYLVVDDIKIRNDFKDFVEVEKVNEQYPITFKKTDEKGNKSAVSISSGFTYIDAFASDDLTIYNDSDSGIADFGQFNVADRKYFLLQNDINDDIDFLKYIQKYGYHKSNIFMSDRKIKENYAINLFIDVVIPRVDSVTLIEGDYSGYIFNLEKQRIRSVSILRNDKAYHFMFYGEQYDDKYLEDILSTLEIK